MNEIILQIVLWTIAALSALIAYEFYMSRDGRLRVLVIWLFCCKVWVYGGAAVMFLIWTPDKIALMRVLILNVPMCFVMLQLWKYIRGRDRV